MKQRDKQSDLICPNCDNTSDGSELIEIDDYYRCLGCKFKFKKFLDIKELRKKLVIVAIFGPESELYDHELIAKLKCEFKNFK